MIEYLNSPLFGVTLTLIVFTITSFLYKKTKSPLLNPILISIIFIIWFLNYFNIDIENYEKGGEIINFFLGPATVALSIPIYKKLDILKKNFFSTLIAISLGSLAGILTVSILSKIFLVEDLLMLSMIPKSTTTAIAIDISEQIKGNPSITIAFVLATGIFGNVFGPSILKFFKIENKLAKGVALGTASHAIGTAKAIELGETEGAMASLAISIAGVITVFLAPIIVKFIM